MATINDMPTFWYDTLSGSPVQAPIQKTSIGERTSYYGGGPGDKVPALAKAPDIKKITAPYGSFHNSLSIDNFTNDTWAEEVDAAFRSSAAGSYTKQMQTFLTGLDRYQRNILPPNAEHSGLTFITRPRLNLQSSSLRQDRTFAPLDGDPAASVNSMQYMIRCLLDTKFCRETGSIYRSPLVDILNPWFTPLGNALNGVSGFTDPIIETFTTDSGFHSEDQTFAIGHDNLNKTYELQLSFKDIQHGPISAIFFYWLRYIYNVTKGTMLAYSDDVDNQRMNYTVSIYRFVMDPSRKTITKFCKATGCFPKSLPLGASFNYGEGETFVAASGRFSIPFVVNKLEYMDYAIFADFNRLAERYWPEINTPGQYVETGDYIDLDALSRHTTGKLVAKSKEDWIKEFSVGDKRSASAWGRRNFEKKEQDGVLWRCGSDNYSGRPFIDTSRGFPRISFRVAKDEIRI